VPSLRNAIRALTTIAVLSAIAMSTSACAALVVGYLVGDSMAKDKATATCRSNLQATNAARIAKGQDPFPDQCGQ
jgi:hypothetical protein